MTVLVGILCKDSVVVGTDSSATFGAQHHPTVEQQTKKLFIINDEVIVATTGAVGLSQRFCHVVKTLCEEAEMLKKVSDHMQVAKQICVSVRKDFAETGVVKGQLGALVAFAFKGKPYLVEYSVEDLQPEFKDENLWYASMGSGQNIADPFLGLMRKVYCPKSPPNLATGLFMTTWTLSHTVDVNPGGIKDPICLATLKIKSDGGFEIGILEEDALNEHRQNVGAAYNHMASFAKFDIDEAPDIPKMPQE